MDLFVTKNDYCLKKMKETSEERATKIFAFWSVATATVAVISAIVILPALHTSAHNLYNEMIEESDFCRMQVRNFWINTYSVKLSKNDFKFLQNKQKLAHIKTNRTKRSWLFGHWISNDNNKKNNFSKNQNENSKILLDSATNYDDAEKTNVSEKNLSDAQSLGYSSLSSNTYYNKNEFGIEISRFENTQPISPLSDSFSEPPQSPVFPPSITPSVYNTKESKKTNSVVSSQSCLCQCHIGSPGPPGEAGDNGKDGMDGKPGTKGVDGRSGEVIIPDKDTLNKERCIICPPGYPGPPGPQGMRGPTGPRGSPGSPGSNGRKGESGLEGSPGPTGIPGAMGLQGPHGVSGRQILRDGIRGPPGKSGIPGPKGFLGIKGHKGKAIIGPKGLMGNPGKPGINGLKGFQGIDGIKGIKGINGDCSHCFKTEFVKTDII